MSDKCMMKRFYKSGVTGIFCLGTFLLNGTFIYAETIDQSTPQETTDTQSETSTEVINQTELEISDNPATAPVQEPDIVKQQEILHISANIEGENKIKLTWEHITGVSSYQISRDNTFMESLLPANEEFNSFMDETVIANQTYVYQIIGFNENGIELASESVSVISMDTIPPEVPAGFEALEVTVPNEITLNWTTVDDAEGYYLYRDGVLLTDISKGNISFSDNTAQPNLTYHYSIKAYDASGNNSPSSDISVLSFDTLPPSVPTIVEGIAVAANQVHLLWTPSTDNRKMSHYNIYLKRTNGDFEFIDKTNINKFIHEGLGNDTFYQYKITAVDLKGNESQYSEIFNVLTYSDPTAVIYDPLPFAINRADVQLIEIVNEKIVEVIRMIENEDEQQIPEINVNENLNDDTTNNSSQVNIDFEIIATLESNLKIKK